MKYPNQKIGKPSPNPATRASNEKAPKKNIHPRNDMDGASGGSGKDGWPSQIITNSAGPGINTSHNPGPGMPAPQSTNSVGGKNSSRDPGPGVKRDHPGNIR